MHTIKYVKQNHEIYTMKKKMPIGTFRNIFLFVYDEKKGQVLIACLEMMLYAFCVHSHSLSPSLYTSSFAACVKFLYDGENLAKSNVHKRALYIL